MIVYSTPSCVLASEGALENLVKEVGRCRREADHSSDRAGPHPPSVSA